MTTKELFLSFKKPAVLGIVSTLPFAFLEIVNGTKYGNAFPIGIFTILFITSLLFWFVFELITKSKKVENGNLKKIAVFVFRVLLLICLLVLFVNIIIDQWPCFMGMPNCD